MTATPTNQDETNPMTFTENQLGNTILEKLRSQRESGKFCDVILYVENKRFHLHRNVLSSFSPYFESIFQTRKAVREKFNITGQSAEILLSFINYMYTGTIVLDKNNVAEMFKLAHRLEVVKLKSYCAEYLERYLDLSNCLAVRDMAHKYDMAFLSKLSTGFIQNHLEEVLTSSELLELDVSRLEAFLSDKSLGLSQMQIIQVIINWTKQDVFKREKQLKTILKLIKWMEIDIQHINDIIENENLFVTSELSLYLMLTHLNENGLTFAKFHSVLDALNQKYSHIQNEKEAEDVETISKVKISKKKLKKRQRLLRANPIARLAALRSALVLRTRKVSGKFYSEDFGLPENEEDDDDSSLRCHLCDHYATDTTTLEQHLSAVHSRDVTYKCGVCGFVCQWNNLYIQHMKGHFPGPPYKCDSCEFSSEKLNEVLTHRSVHVQEKIHRCPHCSFRSKSQSSVLVHSKCHLADKNGQSERPYVCELCGFSSKYLSHLIAHKRIHSGDVYRCSYPHCKYTTGKKSQLVSHAKSHQGVRPHCCNICGRGFLEKSHLVRHERIHLEEKPFKCHECDYASSRRDKLKEHQARHHGDNASAKVPYKARPNKKPNQLFQEGFNDSSRMHQNATANDIPEVLVQNHNIPTPNLNSYVSFTANENHVHHSSSSTVSSSSLDFHHPQLLNSSATRGKEHSASGSGHRSSHQSSAAAVAAAMMLDPRFHHSNTATGTYSTPPVSMATMVNQAAGQVVQTGHQVSEYPTALMSLNPTWWKRRTALERKLIILSLVVVLFAVALAAAAITLVIREHEEYKTTALNASTAEASTWQSSGDFNFRKGKSGFDYPVKNDEGEKVCTTSGCVKAASKVLDNMDPTIDPCDDFYQFACGKFVRETVMPDDKTTITSFSMISDKLKEQLRSVIEEPIRQKEASPFILAKNLYKACMNKKRIAERGHQPLLNILKKLGGWPVLLGEKWNPGNFDWKETVYKFRDSGYSVDYFLDFSIGVDLKNSTVRTIDLDQPSLGLSREYLAKGFDEKIVQAYYEYQVDIAVILGAERAVAEKELKDSLFFEMQLANISLPNEQRRNVSKLFNPMTVSEMQEKFPSIPWLEYFNRLLPKHIQINSDEVIIVDVPSFIKQLEVLLSRTPKRVLANYVMWRAAGASISYLTEDLRNRQLQYSTVLLGKEQRESRWKECIDIVSSGVSLAVGSLYVKKYFREDAKKTALEMVHDIREEFNKILRSLDWMDEETRRQALEKASSMATHIAYPDELLDDSKLESFYGSLTVNPEFYLESVLNLTTFGIEYSFGKLRQPVNKTEWISHGRPAVVNAFYSGIENSIQFPAGILQGIFFSNDRPKYMNYGAIGFVIGHEITHGFDDQGRQFDKEGNLVDWWAKGTEEKFIKRAQCIIDQYGNYTAEEVGLKLNGINTQGENIADNGGIKEAYRAYVQWTKRNGEEPMLPGLPYSPRQMFWISAANTWCCKYRPEALKIRIITGVHSPGRFRVIGPFSNMPEFSKDFNCPLGSKMNPVDKCLVW